jgi:hypothetical protein
MWQQVSLNSIIMRVFTGHYGQKRTLVLILILWGGLIFMSYLECVTSNCTQRISWLRIFTLFSDILGVSHNIFLQLDGKFKRPLYVSPRCMCFPHVWDLAQCEARQMNVRFFCVGAILAFIYSNQPNSSLPSLLHLTECSMWVTKVFFCKKPKNNSYKKLSVYQQVNTKIRYLYVCLQCSIVKNENKHKFHRRLSY